jgi:putative ATP-binding cassette transporter
MVIQLSQTIFWRIRNNIIQMILKSSHQELSKRKDLVQAALIQDVGILTQASLSIVEFSTAIVVVIGCFSYMAVISFPLFLTTIGIASLGVIFYYLGDKKDGAKFDIARSLEDRFMYHFDAILGGFKEIHMSPRKGYAIYEEKIIPIANESYQNNTKAFIGYLNKQMTGQILFYMLISAIILVFSVSLDINVSVTINFIFILLFVLGSIENIMVILPSLAQARISAKRLNNLTEELENQEMTNTVPTEHYRRDDFSGLQIRDVEFTYPESEKNDNGFGVGPISLDIDAQKIIFIYGGNGSGKTTFMHVILGILKASKGEISFNGMSVGDSNYVNYKSLFAPVFSDFYLFDEFYGIRDFDRSKVAEYLKLFEIDTKVEIMDNGFSTVQLSTGQRKRLALISALLEEKPILVLDEWAADQDPYFRKKFYTEIIQKLKSEGYTILAITHDDKYYNCADRLYKMEEGMLVDETELIKMVDHGN